MSASELSSSAESSAKSRRRFNHNETRSRASRVNVWQRQCIDRSFCRPPAAANKHQAAGWPIRNKSTSMHVGDRRRRSTPFRCEVAVAQRQFGIVNPETPAMSTLEIREAARLSIGLRPMAIKPSTCRGRSVRILAQLNWRSRRRQSVATSISGITTGC